MNDADHNTARSASRKRLGAVMLLVLAAALAAAWAVVQVRSAATRRGTQIVQRLQEQGLGQLFGPGRQVHAFLAEGGDGRAHGWKLVRIEPAAEGYSALIVLQLQDGRRAQLYQEQWVADNALTRVEYQATQSVSSAPAMGTSIILEGQAPDRIAAVLNAQGREAYRARSPAPDNYVPEGMLTTAVRMAAEDGQPVNLMLILNNEALQPTRRGYAVHFTPAQIRPISPRQAELHIGKYSETYTFDESGRLERLARQDDVTFRRVPLEELQQRYEVSRYLQ